MSIEDIYIQLDVTADPLVEIRVRETINAWAESIPHHPYKKLGSSIDITAIQNLPTYHLTLQTQYEQREKQTSSRPDHGAPVSSRQYASLSEVNEWSFEMEEVRKFTESDDWYDVKNSEKIETCSSCDGAGRTRCSPCDGTGITTCSQCGGAGNDPCSYCEGTGNLQKSCSSCDGTGSKWNATTKSNERCYSCSGKGRWVEKCYHCNGAGRIVCSSCQGKGRVTCSECHGDGYNSCWECSGQGRVVEYFQVRRKLLFHTASATVAHDQIIQEFPAFPINTETFKGKEVLNLDEKQPVPPSALDRWAPLAALLAKKHQDSLVLASEKTHIPHQQLRVYRADVFLVNYAFNGREYKLLVYENGEKGDVFAPLGPISELRQEYVTAAQAHFSRKEYYDAWHKSKLALELGQDEPWPQRDEVAKLGEKIKSKISNQYLLGQVAGAILAAVIFVPLLLWLIPICGFILRPVTKLYTQAPWMEQIYPYTIYILFLLGLFWVYLASGAFLERFFMFTVASNTARVWLGAGFFLLIAAYAWFLLLLLHSTGLPLLLTYLVKIIAETIGLPLVG